MSNEAWTIAETLDRHLKQRTEVIVFGASSLLLDPDFATRLSERKTNDIDIIVPVARELEVNADAGFWDAIDATNRELAPLDLYVTHIFSEQQVVLTPEWHRHLVKLNCPFKHLAVSRPRILDLIVSKMGRGDMRDLEDVRTMLRLDRAVTGSSLTSVAIGDASARANVPDVYREIFPAARDRILAIAREMEGTQAGRSESESSRQAQSPWQGPSHGTGV